MSTPNDSQNPQNVNQSEYVYTLTPEGFAVLAAADMAEMHERFASLEAAYNELVHENQRMASDLATWNVVTGWVLQDHAEGK